MPHAKLTPPEKAAAAARRAERQLADQLAEITYFCRKRPVVQRQLPVAEHAVLYIRHASAKPGHGIDAQRGRLATEAERRGLPVVNEVTGHHESGASADPAERPGLRFVYDFVRQAQRAGTVIVSEFSHIACNLDAFEAIEKALARYGWGIATPTHSETDGAEHQS